MYKRKLILALALMWMAFIAMSGCDTTPEVDYSIGERSIGGIALSTSMDSIVVPPNTVVSERTESQGGYRWRVRELAFPDGTRVVLEGEYQDVRQPVDSATESIINRIRVEGNSFATDVGLRVGSTLTELRDAYPAAKFVAVHIPDYQIVDVSRPGESRIHFNFSEPPALNVVPDSVAVNVVPMGVLDDSAQIVSIVLAQ